MSIKVKLLFLVTEDWYFYSHRLSLACAARDAGYDVTVLTKVNKHGKEITKHGLKVINIDFNRGDKNPLNLIKIIKQISKIYSQEKPILVHHVSLKPVVLGTVASLISRVPYVINALTGLGSVFVSESIITRIVKIIIMEPILNILINRKNTWTILQNIDDKKQLKALGIINNERTVLIKGSGVNINLYKQSVETNSKPIVVFASRMIKDKGVEEFVVVARELVKEGINASFVLVGDIDPGNPWSVTKSDLLKWREEGIVEWWGHRDDMYKVFELAHIVCLPSLYGEGLPKVLLEAAASGRPIIASDIPGCREIVQDGENGLLVPIKNRAALAIALKKLINDKSLRENMGKKGRIIVEKEFSAEKINSKTIELYDKVLTSNL